MSTDERVTNSEGGDFDSSSGASCWATVTAVRESTKSSEFSRCRHRPLPPTRRPGPCNATPGTMCNGNLSSWILRDGGAGSGAAGRSESSEPGKWQPNEFLSSLTPKRLEVSWGISAARCQDIHSIKVRRSWQANWTNRWPPSMSRSMTMDASGRRTGLPAVRWRRSADQEDDTVVERVDIEEPPARYVFRKKARVALDRQCLAQRRRKSFRSVPRISISAPGTQVAQDIIKTVKQGLYVTDLIGFRHQ